MLSRLCRRVRSRRAPTSASAAAATASGTTERSGVCVRVARSTLVRRPMSAVGAGPDDEPPCLRAHGFRRSRLARTHPQSSMTKSVDAPAAQILAGARRPGQQRRQRIDLRVPRRRSDHGHGGHPRVRRIERRRVDQMVHPPAGEDPCASLGPAGCHAGVGNRDRAVGGGCRNIGVDLRGWDRVGATTAGELPRLIQDQRRVRSDRGRWGVGALGGDGRCA